MGLQSGSWFSKLKGSAWRRVKLQIINSALHTYLTVLNTIFFIIISFILAWTSWSGWSTCSVTCFKTRTRSCSLCGGKGLCPGERTDSTTCFVPGLCCKLIHKGCPLENVYTHKGVFFFQFRLMLVTFWCALTAKYISFHLLLI